MRGGFLMRALWLAFLVWLLAPAPAHALLCTPLLGCTCTVTAASVDFEAIAPLAGVGDAAGEVSVSCTGVIDIAPSIEVRLGSGQWGGIAQRRMRGPGGALLDYNLYSNTQRTIIWGEGGAAPSVMVSGGFLNLGAWSATRAIYARVSPQPTTRAGAYADTVTVRIVW